MNRTISILCCISIVMLMQFPINAGAGGESMVNTVMTGCKKEIKSYCGKVTPGEGRILACLYAHNDKISGRCEYALYDAAAQLERAVAALSYVVNECEDDLREYCGSVRAGEGRLANCLLVKNKDNISKRCAQAAKDVELKYKR